MTTTLSLRPKPVPDLILEGALSKLASTKEPGRQKGRRLQSDRDGPFFTGFLPHSYGYGAANPAKTVLAGVTFRFDAYCRPGSWGGPTEA